MKKRAVGEKKGWLVKKRAVGVENRLYGADKGRNGQLNIENGR